MSTVRRYVADRLTSDPAFTRLAIRHWKVICLQGENMDPEGRAGSLLQRIDQKLKHLPVVKESGASMLEFSRALQRFELGNGRKK